MLTQIAPQELADWLADTARPQPLLLDVREPWEFAQCAIAGADLMPMATVPAQFESIDAEREIVCICHHGMRSQQVAMFLTSRGYEKVFNLRGGIHAWAEQVDRSMPTY